MKKLLLFLTVALLGCIGATAQSSLIGTLSHDGEVTVFYGSDALIKAHEAAVPGDVITLSAGTFTGLHLTKGITLRGAGMSLEGNATIISGSLYLEATSKEFPLTLEGLKIQTHYFNKVLTGAKFIKCRFDSNGSEPGGYLIDVQFVNCDIQQYSAYSSGTIQSPSDITFTNCVIRKFYIHNSSLATTRLNNCIVTGISANSGSSGTRYAIESASFSNCIILSTINKSDEYFTENNVLKNCIIKSTTENPLRYNGSHTNCTRVDQNFELFKSDSFYVLTEEIAETKLGDDGTQAGIYGGIMPFDPTPTNPQITKFNVANKTSTDGKLSVDIEVSAAN